MMTSQDRLWTDWIFSYLVANRVFHDLSLTRNMEDSRGS